MRRILLVLTVALVMAAMMLGTALPAGAVVVVPLPPTSKEQCKNGGYAFFGFENQGQCIKFVNQLT
jgi:hypothetical protein